MLNDIPVQTRREGVLKGGYIALKEEGELKTILLASGSEVQHAFAAAKELGAGTRVVSMPCMERFNGQTAEYRESVLPSSCRRRVAIEAGVPETWYRYVGLDGKVVGSHDLRYQRSGQPGDGASGHQCEVGCGSCEIARVTPPKNFDLQIASLPSRLAIFAYARAPFSPPHPPPMAEATEIPEASNPFEKRVALTIALLAVVLALVENLGDNAKTSAILKTNEAANQWSYYQSKSIKQNLYETESRLVGFLSTANEESQAKTKAEIASEVARYQAEKGEIRQSAERSWPRLRRIRG